MAALRALTDHDIRRVIRVPQDTDRMAGVDQLCWSESHGESYYGQQEKLAGLKYGAWIRRHLEDEYGLKLPKAVDGLLTSLEDDPQDVDIESHLMHALEEKLHAMNA